MKTYSYDRRYASRHYYHGTSGDFTEFELSEAGARDFGDFGLGIYLTPSSVLARTYAYASAKKTGREPKVLVVNVRVRKTADVDDPDLQKRIADATGAPFPKRLTGGPQTRPRSEATAITRFLQSGGYDSALGRGGKELVVFDPHLLSIERSVPAEEAGYLI